MAMADAVTGVDFKKELREGKPKLGLFLNAHSPTVAEQLAHSGYDWLLVDTQHGPMGYEKLSAMLSAISNGGAKSMVRVGGYNDRPGIQQALDLGGWRAGSLHQHSGGSAAGGELHKISDGGDAVGLFSAEEHEQSRVTGVCGKRE
jgi:hypothetical protein